MFFNLGSLSVRLGLDWFCWLGIFQHALGDVICHVSVPKEIFKWLFSARGDRILWPFGLVFAPIFLLINSLHVGLPGFLFGPCFDD